MESLRHFLIKRPSKVAYDITLLIARLSLGGMMLTHGWPKLVNYSERSSSFPDPLGIGNELSLISTLLAEFVCALLLMVGLASRLALIPLMFAMFVAGFIHHFDDPFSSKEKALLFLVAFLVLFVTGPGKYSADHFFFKKGKK